MKIESKFKISLRKLLIPLLVFIATLVVSFFAWQKAEDLTHLEREDQFTDIVTQNHIYIQGSIDEYIDILYGARGLFAASIKVDSNEWNAYVNSLPIDERFPGMQALSFITRVPLEEKENFVTEVQSDTTLSPEGNPNFTIYPEGDREEYYVVTYIEPFEGNEAAFGFDLFSNSSRRAGLEEARDTNKPVATAPIRLVQEKGEQMGFLVFLPVYKNNASIETVGEKREALIGYISAVFRAGDLLTEFLNVFPESKSVHLEVVDTRAQKEGETDYSVFNQYTPENYAHEFTAERSITVGGREWMLSFHELPGFSALVGAERYVPTAVVVAGVLFSLLLFLILYSFSTSRDRALSLAKSMTTEINKSKNDMKKVLQEAKESKAESEEMNDAMVGREMRMIELKEEIAKLKSKE